MARVGKQTEFTGGDGMPVDELNPTASEQLMLMYGSGDPADETAGIGLGGEAAG